MQLVSEKKSNYFISDILDRQGYFAISSSASLSGIASKRTDATTELSLIIQNEIYRKFSEEIEPQYVLTLLTTELSVKQDRIVEEVTNITDTYIENHFLRKLTNNLKKLHSFENLEDGWDGYNAPKIPKAVIDNTIRLVSHPELMKHQPEVFTTARESIQLEYHKPNDDYLEIEVFSDYFIIYQDQHGNEKEEESNDITSVVRAINEFHSRFRNNR